MAFLDQLSTKLTQVGQATARKTKELTDTAKINLMIAEEEKKITAHLTKLGACYLEQHPDDFEDAFADLIAEIRASREKINQGKQQLIERKGVAHCPNCGAQVSNRVAFCSACGSKVEPTGGFDICPTCGEAVEKGMCFCTSCGKPMPNRTQDDQTGKREAADIKHTCPDCGTEISEGLSFCTECGKKL